MKKILFLLVLVAICGTSTAQDLIVKRNAEEIDAKILRSEGGKIEYTRSGNSGGQVYTIPTGDILFVKYSDGRKEVFDTAPARPPRITAQYNDHFPHYQGEAAISYALGVGEEARFVNTSRVIFETVHGVRLSPYAFIGLGAGFNYFYSEDMISDLSTGGAGAVAGFANLKGYYPVSEGASVYLSLDLGATIGVWNMPDLRNIYTAVGPGISFGNSRDRLRCDISVRYQYLGESMDAVMIRIGLGF